MEKITKKQYEKGLQRNIAICKSEFLKWLRKEIIVNWGTKCDEVSRGCPRCEAWRFFEKLK